MHQHFLFVCLAGKERSLTAATLFAERKKIEAKYCGIHLLADIRITSEAVCWADTIFCMEEMHRKFIEREFPEEIRGKNLVVLGILDIYPRGQPELIAILRKKLKEWL